MRFIRFKAYNFVLVSLIIATVSFGAGYVFSNPIMDWGDIFNKGQGTTAENFDLNLFWEALDRIEEKYINRNNLNYQKLVEGAVSGMVNSLDDPYTVFLNESDLQDFREGIDGIFEGIGAEIGVKNRIITIISPLEDSPAQKSGLKAGDKVLKINDAVTTEMTVEEAVKQIRGPKDTVVTLLISREGWSEAKAIEIRRGVINVPSVKWAMKEDDIAHVQLFRFGPETGSDFRRIATEITNSKAKKIILDLRNNPGGFLETSVEIASVFLPEGKLVVTEDYGNDKKDEYKTSGKPLLENYPLVILMNQGSASAAEILAGALKDQKNIQLIGETTFGKGSVQELESLRSGGAVKITVARWLTPSGKTINDAGIKPDVEVKTTDEPEKDPQLDKAIEVTKGL